MSALEQANLAISRITKALGISRDVSIVLLLAHKWEEEKIINLWSLSYEDISTSLGVIPEFEVILHLRQTRCALCTENRQCQLLGCSHDVCVECIEGYATSKVLNGELNLRCPIPRCGKIAASSAILHYLSTAANVIFNQNLANHFIAAKAEDKDLLDQAVETLITKMFVFFRMLEGMVIKLWRKRIALIASFLLILCFCNSFCVGDRRTCVRELTLVILFATALGVWGNIMKAVVLCLSYKVFHSESYSIWIVLVLSFACCTYLIFKMLGGWVLLLTSLMRSWISS